MEAAPRPKEVVDAAGAWIGAALAPDGFTWLPRTRLLRRQVGTLSQRISLQPSGYNRTGGRVTISSHVSVHDPALRRWRTAHPRLVAGPVDDVVCVHLLGYASGRANGYVYGDAGDGDIDLTDPAERQARLTAFVAKVRAGVLPWFAEAGAPDTIVDSVAGDRTNRPPAVVEWLASLDRVDLVHAYADRYRARHPGTDDRWDAGAAEARAGRPSPPGGDVLAALAWSVTVLTT